MLRRYHDALIIGLKITLKGHWSRINFCSVVSKHFLTKLKSNFTKFERSTTIRFRRITASISLCEVFFLSEILPELPIRTFQKSYCMFLKLYKCFATDLLSRQSKGFRLYIGCFSRKCKPVFQKLIFSHNTDKMATLKYEENS